MSDTLNEFAFRFLCLCVLLTCRKNDRILMLDCQKRELSNVDCEEIAGLFNIPLWGPLLLQTSSMG